MLPQDPTVEILDSVLYCIVYMRNGCKPNTFFIENPTVEILNSVMYLRKGRKPETIFKKHHVSLEFSVNFKFLTVSIL